MKISEEKITEVQNEIKGLDLKLSERCNNLEEKITNWENTTKGTVRLLENQLRTLENAEESRKRRERWKNIIIKSKDFDDDTRSEMDEKIRGLLRKIECKEEYTRATYLGKDKSDRGLVRLEARFMEDKITIMNRSKLKGED